MVTRRNLGLPLTPEILADMYGYLASTKPYTKWHLPHKSDVEFKVMRMRDTAGDYTWDKKRRKHIIRISSRCVGSTYRLAMIMAHEMLHAVEVVTGTVTAGAMHNKTFLRMSDQVCKLHGFDRHDFAEIE